MLLNVTLVFAQIYGAAVLAHVLRGAMVWPIRPQRLLNLIGVSPLTPLQLAERISESPRRGLACATKL